MKTEFKITYFFWKARKDASGLIPIYIRSKQNSDKQISHFTGVKLLTDQWNHKKKVPKNKPAKLMELETILQVTYTALLREGFQPNLNDLLTHRKDVQKPSDLNIVAWCEDYLKAAYSEGQKKAVHTLKTNLTDHKKTLTFDKLTKPIIKVFFEWLTKQGVANNSQYKRLRSLINVCEHANLDIPDLKNYEMPYTTVNAFKPRLTWQEVEKVIDTEANTNLEQIAKDVFLLACFSGLRIDDILTLDRGELHEFYYERIQNKTKLPVLVTIHGRNEKLFKKFLHGVGYTRQALSSSLKPILKRSGLTQKVTRIQAVGYAFKDVVKPKYEEIAFHSGRRFYARLLNDLGLGGEIARDELGHSFKSLTDLYAGSQEHSHRVARVRKSIETIQETYKELALMKVA